MNEYSEPCDEEASSGDRCSVDEEADLPPVLYGLEVQRVCCNRKRGLALGVGMSRFKSKEGMDSRADAPGSCRRACSVVAITARLQQGVTGCERAVALALPPPRGTAAAAASASASASALSLRDLGINSRRTLLLFLFFFGESNEELVS